MPKVSVNYVRLEQQSCVVLTFENKAHKEESLTLLQNSALNDELRAKHSNDLSVVIAVFPKKMTLQETFDSCKTVLAQKNYTLDYHPSCEINLAKQLDEAASEIWLQTRKRLITIHSELKTTAWVKDIWSGVLTHAANATNAVETAEWKKASVVKKSELLSRAIEELQTVQKIIGEKKLAMTPQEDQDFDATLLEGEDCYNILTNNFSEFRGLNMAVFNQAVNTSNEMKATAVNTAQSSTSFLGRIFGAMGFAQQSNQSKNQDVNADLNYAISSSFYLFDQEFKEVQNQIQCTKSTDEEKKAALAILNKICSDPNFKLEENKPNTELYLILKEAQPELQKELADAKSCMQLGVNGVSSEETLHRAATHTTRPAAIK